MEFPNAKVKAVNANIGSGVITISFSLDLNDENLEAAKALALYDDQDNRKVDVSVNPNSQGCSEMKKIFTGLPVLILAVLVVISLGVRIASAYCPTSTPTETLIDTNTPTETMLDMPTETLTETPTETASETATETLTETVIPTIAPVKYDRTPIVGKG